MGITKDLFLKTEKYRLNRHFIKVRNKLDKNSKRIVDLSHEQQQNRMRNIQLIEQYRSRNQFPINTDYPGQTLPHIRDNQGTLCAMAYLFHKSGNDDIVEYLATTDNTILVDDIDDILLNDWLNKEGLTKKEASMIQPTYNYYYDAVESYVGRLIILIGMLIFAYMGYLLSSLGRFVYRVKTKSLEFISNDTEHQEIHIFTLFSRIIFLMFLSKILFVLSVLEILVDTNTYRFETFSANFNLYSQGPGDFSGNNYFIIRGYIIVLSFVIMVVSFQFSIFKLNYEQSVVDLAGPVFILGFVYFITRPSVSFEGSNGDLYSPLVLKIIVFLAILNILVHSILTIKSLQKNKEHSEPKALG